MAINRQGAYLEAENKAYDNLVKAGFLPQGYNFKKKKVCVLKGENEHKNNMHTEVYLFENWQETMETLYNEITTLNNSKNVLWNDTIAKEMINNFYMDYFTNIKCPLNVNKQNYGESTNGYIRSRILY